MDKVNYISAGGIPTYAQREYARDSALYNMGDMVLIWASQSDLCLYGNKIDSEQGDQAEDQSVSVSSSMGASEAPAAQSFSGGGFPVVLNLRRGEAIIMGLTCGAVGGMATMLVRGFFNV